MIFKLKGKVIFFATNNIHKFHEARRVLDEYRMSVCMLRVKALEIQSDSLEEIAKQSAIDSFKRCGLPLIVEDAGLFIDTLDGFPGPYAAYTYRTIGNRGLLKLMEKVEERTAIFRSVIAYHSSDLKSPKCFEGEALGKITKKERRESNHSGFGFDPIFKPIRRDRTFAEMKSIQKNQVSHRAIALRKFASWYQKL